MPTFEFSLGTNFQNSLIVTISFIAALAAIGIGLNATVVMKLVIESRKRGFVERG